MICPECNKEIDRVIVESRCWQWGTLAEGTNKIVDYSSIEEIMETTSIKCPECGCMFRDGIIQSE